MMPFGFKMIIFFNGTLLHTLSLLLKWNIYCSIISGSHDFLLSPLTTILQDVPSKPITASFLEKWLPSVPAFLSMATVCTMFISAFGFALLKPGFQVRLSR